MTEASAFADISVVSDVSVPPGDDRGLCFCWLPVVADLHVPPGDDIAYTLVLSIYAYLLAICRGHCFCWRPCYCWCAWCSSVPSFDSICDDHDMLARPHLLVWCDPSVAKSVATDFFKKKYWHFPTFDQYRTIKYWLRSKGGWGAIMWAVT